jgi:hypothetical protein
MLEFLSGNHTHQACKVVVAKSRKPVGRGSLAKTVVVKRVSGKPGKKRVKIEFLNVVFGITQLAECRSPDWQSKRQLWNSWNFRCVTWTLPRSLSRMMSRRGEQ